MGSDVHQFVPFKKIGNLILPKTSTNTLKLLNPNADALVLGSATEEGGDIKVYRDASGNLQMSVDADAASNAKALDIYGGVVAQNHVTIGQTALDISATLYVVGTVKTTDHIYIANGKNYLWSVGGGYIKGGSNASFIGLDIPVAGADSAAHRIKMMIDSNEIIVVQATGDGAGGIVNKAIGLYGTTPATQAAAINDPAESTAANNAAIDSILAALRGIGLIAT